MKKKSTRKGKTAVRSSDMVRRLTAENWDDIKNILRDYAATHPRWTTFAGEPQDPMGVHAILVILDTPNQRI